MLVRDRLTKAVVRVTDIVKTPWGPVYQMGMPPNISYRNPMLVDELTESDEAEYAKRNL